MRVIQTTILYEEVPICGPSLYLIVVWLKWHVTREVRYIYETAKNSKEVEQRLRDLIDYMKWKSDETLSAYEHYFDQQRNADKREGLQQQMHTEVQRYLEERQRGKQEIQAKLKETFPSVPTVHQRDSEPNLDFLYSLAGEG